MIHFVCAACQDFLCEFRVLTKKCFFCEHFAKTNIFDLFKIHHDFIRHQLASSDWLCPNSSFTKINDWGLWSATVSEAMSQWNKGFISFCWWMPCSVLNVNCCQQLLWHKTNKVTGNSGYHIIYLRPCKTWKTIGEAERKTRVLRAFSGFFWGGGWIFHPQAVFQAQWHFCSSYSHLCILYNDVWPHKRHPWG